MGFFLKGKKSAFSPHAHALQELGLWELPLLRGCSGGEGAAPVGNSGKLLAPLSEIL